MVQSTSGLFVVLRQVLPSTRCTTSPPIGILFRLCKPVEPGAYTPLISRSLIVLPSASSSCLDHLELLFCLFSLASRDCLAQFGSCFCTEVQNLLPGRGPWMRVSLLSFVPFLTASMAWRYLVSGVQLHVLLFFNL